MTKGDCGCRDAGTNREEEMGQADETTDGRMAG